MRSLRVRILCFVLILAMLPGFFALGATEASAAYENTWKNTGDMRTDLIQVALTQVGYKEGSNNYTKYGAWYGAANTAWCGVFISWCANQAGIPTSILRRNGWATIRDFGITDIFKYSSGRQPRPGDLYMKNDGSHVGIVYYVEGNYFYTIEGNTSSGTSSTPNCVAIKRKSLTGSYTFGSPNYTSDSGHNYKSYTESSHPHREYMYCDHVTIGDNCWIGANSVICPGVTIGENTVIGAGSVVTKDIPANCVAAGNPCKVIREINDHDMDYYYRDRRIDPEDLEEERKLRSNPQYTAKILG